MVMLLAIPLRKFYHLQDFVTLRHLDNCGKFMIATGLLVTYTYVAETFFSWYGSDVYGSWWSWSRRRPVHTALFGFWTYSWCARFQ